MTSHHVYGAALTYRTAKIIFKSFIFHLYILCEY